MRMGFVLLAGTHLLARVAISYPQTIRVYGAR